MSNTPLSIPELGDKFVDYRQEIWGDSYDWAWNRRTDQIVHLAIHHSVTPHDYTPDQIALIHKNRGWGGIGYHFIITKDGKVWYVGDVSTARANVANMNEKVIGICMVGDFTKHLPSDEQITSCHLLCNFFIEQANWPNLNNWDCVAGHKQLQATACPGTSWDKSQDGDMWWRIKTGTPYTPPPAENGSTEAGQDVTIQTYEKFVDDLIEASKAPSDKRKLPALVGWVETLRLEARQKDSVQKQYDDLLKEVARVIKSPVIEEKAVLDMLRGLEKTTQSQIGEIKKKKLIEFDTLDLVFGIIYKVLTFRLRR